MFKKRGGLAFKPKIPSARPRQPTAPSAAPQRAKTVDSQIAPEASREEDRLDNAELLGSDKASDGAANSEATHPTPAGQPSPTPVPAPTQRPDTPSAATQPEPSKETPVEEPVANATVSSKPKDVVRGTPQVRPEPSFHERESRPPTIHTSGATTTQETPKAVEKSPPANVVVAVTSQKESPPSDETPASAPEASAPKPRAKRAAAPRTKKSAEDETAAARPKKRQRRSPQNEETESEPTTTTTTRMRRRQPAADGEARSRRARSLTPEDAENQVVDLQNLKMADLTRDLHIGKKFSRHDELRDRERQKRIRAKMKKDGELVEEEEENESGTQTPAGSSGTGQRAASSDATAAAGPQFRIVDGQIVLDQSSLVMDRHARAAATQGDMEAIEENDFTRLITSNSFMNTSKLKGPNIWTADETELFYRGLRMFGTDFEMISKMFAGKQRRHIKLKFNREERHNPAMIDSALIGEKTIKMDIDEYKAVTGAEFESVESIEAEQRRIEEEFEAERKRVADEEAETMRKKREALFADDDGTEGDVGKKKKKGKKKKNANPDQYGEVVAME